MHLADGQDVPLWFNDSLGVFAAKGDDEQDRVEVTRAVVDTRPLGLKNTDNKTIGGVVNMVVKPVLSKSAIWSQRGFVPQRQLIRNVLDLDTAARIVGDRGHNEFDAVVNSASPAAPRGLESDSYDLHHRLQDGSQSSSKRSPGQSLSARAGEEANNMMQMVGCNLCPLLAFWDFAAAFASVAHGWLHVILEEGRFPSGFKNIIKAMYTLVRMYTECDSELVFLCWVLRGVLQGCPLSGMLFAYAVDPFLRKMERKVDIMGRGATRACADDIGAAITSISVLAVYKPIFDSAADLAGLMLKAKKCVLVPVAAKFTEETADKIRQWLHDHIHEWRNFQVQACGTYLGFEMGPVAGASQWTKPFTKYAARAKAIALMHAPPTASAYNYNMKAVPILCYKPQLTLIPDRIEQLERPLALHVMHFATNSLDDKTLFTLNAFGGPTIRSARASALAALARAARKTLPSWEQKAELIRGSRGNHSAIGSIINGKCWGEFWDSPPIAITLEAAAKHFTESAVALLGLPPRSFIMRHRVRIERASKAAERALLRNPKLPTQKTFYNEFLKAFYGDMQIGIFEKRLRVAFSSVCNPLPIIDWDPAARILKSAPAHVVIMVLKTWSNSWSTSDRYHDGRIEHCCFGCFPEPDSLAHYLVCDALWATVSSATHHRCPDDPLERLCIDKPTSGNLRNLVVAYSTYHTMKHGYLTRIRVAEAFNEWESLLDFAGQVAQVSASRWPGARATAAGV
jgi:hypothetical protein